MVYTQEGVIKDSRPWWKIFAAGAAAITLAAGMFASAFAVGTVVVTPTDTQGWTSNQANVAETRANGQVNFVADANTPFGTGALQLKTGETSGGLDKAQYKKVEVIQLSDVNNLAYSTKQVSASLAAGLPSYQLSICLYGATSAGCNAAPAEAAQKTSFTNFVFEPYVSEGNAAVQPNTWQTWDVDAGNFWSSGNIGSSSNTLSGYPVWTLSELKAKFPSATVVSFGINVGSYNPNYDTRVDGVVFNDATYDFEVTAPDMQAPSAPQNLGWKNPMLACGSQTSSYTITADWSDSTDNTAVTSYNYQVKTPLRATWADAYNTSVNTSEYNGAFTEGEGTYTYRVQAVDAAGNKSDWSNECAVTYDTTPQVLGTQDCKNGGYLGVYTKDNKPFKNQGACVSYVQANANASFKRGEL